ncbi:MAG: hypothetical protein ACR2K3_13350 [Nocardioides sp.]
MRPRLEAIASQQGGLVTRAQARDLGYRGPELRGLTAVGGAWVVVRRGVYIARALWEASSALERWQLRDRAAHLTTEVAHELSHDSAARLHGLPLVSVKRELTHLTRPNVQGSRTEHGVKHHLGPVPSPSRVVIHALPATGLARTALDVAREHGLPTGLAACDAARRLGVSCADFTDELACMTHWRGVICAREAASLADPRPENAAESLARLLVIELGIGTPEPQFALLIHGRVIWCDLRVGNHVFEFDGRIKYRGRTEGGVALKPAEQVVWEERQREREVCAEGLGVSRLDWNELFGAARIRAKKRLLEEYAVTLARFGPRLPDHLAAFSRLHSHDRVPRFRAS